MSGWIRTAAGLAALMLFLATFVSHLEQTAQLPAWLTGVHLRYWTSSRTFLGVPVEYFLGFWFLAVVVRDGASDLQCAPLIRFWSGIIVCAIGAGLLYRVGIRCLPLSFATGAALIVVLESGSRLPAARVTSVWGAVRHDWETLRRPHRLVRFVAVGAMGIIVAQYLGLTAKATTGLDRDAQLIRWFEAEPRITVGDLVAPGKIRVVAFSDFECPACAFQIPALEKTVNRYQTAGHGEVELVLKDFPLNADCNSAVSTRVHPLACRAAVAARAAQKALGQLEGQAFRGRLYARHGRLDDAALGRELETMGLMKTFHETQNDELEAVRKDADLGAALGLTGTPTIFVDGRLVRDAQPSVISAILSYLLRKLRSEVRS